jgi:hypothetical protein
MWLLPRSALELHFFVREAIMDFTHKINVGPAVSGILAITVMGLIGWLNHVAPAPAPIVATQDAFAVQKFFQTSDAELIVPAMDAPAPGFQAAKPAYYQPVAWYGSKHWWKRNAPIVGGAGGGALVGGLVGGGKGALIGGAVGGGGGYLYKRHRHHRHY